MKDSYKVLGVKRSASKDEIHAAYLRLAQKLHPDKNVGFEEWAKGLFQEVQAAYDVLGNAKKRRAYDSEGARPRVVVPIAGDPIKQFIATIQNQAAELLRAELLKAQKDPTYIVKVAHRMFGPRRGVKRA